MKLTVFERIMLGSMMSQVAGKFETLKIVREGREALSFTPDELKSLDFRSEDGMTKWSQDASIRIGEVDIPLSDSFEYLVKKKLMEMNEADPPRLTEQHMTLFQKFVLGI